MVQQDDSTNTADQDDALAQAMDEEFEEARDGAASVSPEDERSQRMFPDSEPLDPPYGLDPRASSGAPLEFGLDTETLGLLDGGSGSSRTEQTATRHAENLARLSPQRGEPVADDHELIPAVEEPRSKLEGRMPQLTPQTVATADLMGQLSAMLQQTLQNHVAPALDRMMMSQAAVMSRLDRLESERDSQTPLSAQGEQVLAMLQSLEVGSKPSAGGAQVDAALKQPTSVPADVSPGSAAGVQDSRLHHARDLASKGSGSAHVEAPTHRSKGVTVVEGISYDWRITPDGLKLTRVQERDRGRESGSCTVSQVLDQRSVSPFQATSVHHEVVTPNIRRVHTTSPPRSRSTPKQRNAPVARVEVNPERERGGKGVSTPGNDQAVGRLLYPISPGGTVIRPPPPPQHQVPDQWTGSWETLGPKAWGAYPPPPPIPAALRTTGIAGQQASIGERSSWMESGFRGSSGEASGNKDSGLDPPPGIGEKPEEPTKTTLELPKLDKYNPATSAIVAGDWLIALTPVITSLSASAWVFWEDCVSTARLFYARWLSSSPLERLHIQAEVLVNRYRDGRYSRVDQRAVSLLLAAVGSELKDDLISLRLLGTCAIVFKVMAKYQPGGAAEKQQLLSFLVSPDTVTTSSASVKALRKWRRWLARARELQVIVPDPSLQLKGLERLTPTLSDTAAFRVQTFRMQALLDQAPTQQTVLQFSELLLAEAEEAILSETADKGGAKQTVAKADEVPGKGGKGGKEGKGGSKGAAKADAGKQSCRLWRTDDGCKYGKSCTFAHDALTPADKRCFNCSSTKHRKPDCPYPRAQAEGKGSQKGKSRDEAMKAQDKAASETEKSARDELIAKANAVLESIQTSIKAVQLGSKYPPKPGPLDETGLIDSGATTCMRVRRGDEQPVGEKTVSLAQGEVQMGFSAGGVLLASEEVEPIVSLRQLIAIGFRLVWSKRACQLFDEEGCSVPLSTVSGCPRVCKTVAQNLIDRIETFNIHGYGEDQLARVREADTALWEDVMFRVAESVKAGRLRDAQMWHQVLCGKLFPELLRAAAQSVSLISNGTGPPGAFNRRRRRAVERSTGVVLHLFCGKTRHEFDSVASKHGATVIAVDLTEDLNDPATYTYLLKLALAGKVVAVISGLPCETRSTLLPAVRARDGVERFGLEGISHLDRKRVDCEDHLMLRSFVLGIASKWGRDQVQPGRLEGFPYLLESERDPLEIAGSCHWQAPSIWATPELDALRKTLGLELLRLDQGPLGHACRKPTTVACLKHLWPSWAMNIRGPGQSSDALGCSVDWARWAPGFVQAVGEYVDAAFQQGSTVESLRRLQVQQSMKDHVLAGHVPYRKDCYACVAGRAKKQNHYRQTVSDSFVLSVDLAGPFKRGVHEGAKARYFLAAVFSIPRAPELNGSKGDKPEATEGVVLGEPGEWEKADEDDRDDDDGAGVGPIELDDAPEDPEPQPLEQLELVHLPFVVPLPSKGARDVMNGIKGIEARLCAMGCHVARLHSDAGKEFCNNMLRTWAKERGMHKTNTGGDRFKANPFAENLIGILKGCARTLMKESDVSDQDWPYAIRHACAQRFRDQAVKLGWDIPRLIPFGSKVHVLQRSWHLARGGEWKSRVVEAKVLAPARELSAGYLVRTVEDHLVNVPCVYEDLVHTNPEEFHIPADKAKPASPAVIPDVRVRRKTSLSARKPERPVADESVAVLQGLLSEDEHASCLASIEPFDVYKAQKFVLGSRWIRNSSGRLGARFGESAGSARVLGFYCHGGVVGLTKDCIAFPGFTKLFNRLVQHLMPGHVCTTLAVLSQTTAKPHNDKFNQPTSNAVIPLEVPRKGGGIWVQDESGKDLRWVTPKQQAPGTVHQLSPLCPFLLNPHKWHATEDWSEGSRILLVAYSLKGLDKATEQQLQGLRDVGFKLTAGEYQQGGVGGRPRAKH